MKNLENYRAIADSIATLYSPHAEVIIHDVKTHTIVHIANNISNQKQEENSTLDQTPSGLGNVNRPGPNEKNNGSSGQTRSITTVLKNDKGEPEALLCININFSALETALDVLNGFLEPRRNPRQLDSLFRDDWQDRIDTFIQSWLHKRHLPLASMSRRDKSLLVEALYIEGAFEGKNAADYVALFLTMSRTTVYKYLRFLRQSI